MKISAEDVSRAAELACLQLSEHELRRYTGELSTILEHFSRLQEVNTDGIEPFAHAAGLPGTLRDDVASESLPVEEALGNAPERHQHCIRVPRILET
jgi:aspartyl-tRNA(Asn)/glutamyl-tRNA(Gln) amidotransferase subunit C